MQIQDEQLKPFFVYNNQAVSHIIINIETFAKAKEKKRAKNKVAEMKVFIRVVALALAIAYAAAIPFNTFNQNAGNTTAEEPPIITAPISDF